MVKLIGDAAKEYMLTFLIGQLKDMKEILFLLFNWLLKSPNLACHNWLFIGIDKQLYQNSSIKCQELDQKNISKIF